MTKAFHDAASIEANADQLRQLEQRCRSLSRRYAAIAKQGVGGIEVNLEQRRRTALEWMALWLDDADSKCRQAERKIEARA